MLTRALFRFGFVSLLLGSTPAAVADVPQFINYQGMLVDPGGHPVTTPVNVTFTVYDAVVDGDPKWTESCIVTPDSQGRINIALGITNPIDDGVFAGPARWLEVQVDGDPPMVPRA